MGRQETRLYVRGLRRGAWTIRLPAWRSRFGLGDQPERRPFGSNFTALPERQPRLGRLVSRSTPGWREPGAAGLCPEVTQRARPLAGVGLCVGRGLNVWLSSASIRCDRSIDRPDEPRRTHRPAAGVGTGRPLVVGDAGECCELRTRAPHRPGWTPRLRARSAVRYGEPPSRTRRRASSQAVGPMIGSHSLSATTLPGATPGTDGCTDSTVTWMLSGNEGTPGRVMTTPASGCRADRTGR